jgi:X-Pro dipeptidyl-peptidase
MSRVLTAASLAALVAATLAVVPGQAGATPPAPVFQDGQAQPVFDPRDVIREDIWVRAPVDSDHDGRPDEVHAVVVRPRATELGMKVPVVYEMSPYYAGGNDVANHDVDVELWYPGRPGPDAITATGATDAATDAADDRRAATLGPAPAIGSPRYEEYFLARGFAMVFAESLGSGESTGCPTSGGRNETIGATSVVDWLNGRAAARDRAGAPVLAPWTTGRVAMMGVSYNGTLPNAVATTGVRGLEAIVPIAAISSWYDYYRADGAVVAPGTFQGEDTDVLANYVLTRADSEICRPVIDAMTRDQDRLSGDYSRFWAERDYLRDVRGVRAAVLAVHGLNDWNVKTQHVAQWYAALRRLGVPHKIWLHQFGHRSPLGIREAEWLATLNRWFSRYLYGLRNGIEHQPRATIQREDRVTWTEEAEWPAPGTRGVDLRPTAGGVGTGGLVPTRPGSGHADPAGAAADAGLDGHGHGRPVVESLTDDATVTAESLAAAATSPHRLSYDTAPVAAATRISGTVRAELRMSFDRPAANVTALLVDRAPDGSVHVITRGWTDPQNRHAIDRTERVRPGEWYTLGLTMQPDDYVLAAGHRFGVVLLSSDHDYTLRPSPGAGLRVDLARTTVTLPVVGGVLG